jgi:uncharacterized membrane protein YhaH (DUF805 family)
MSASHPLRTVTFAENSVSEESGLVKRLAFAILLIPTMSAAVPSGPEGWGAAEAARRSDRITNLIGISLIALSVLIVVLAVRAASKRDLRRSGLCLLLALPIGILGYELATAATML